MTPAQRERVDRTLRGLVAEYGAWAVLWRVSQVLKPEFVEMGKAEPKPKQPRKRKPDGKRAAD